MKLLSPSEFRDTKAQEIARDALRTKELNKAADSARKNLTQAEAAFAQTLAGQRARWAREEQEHLKDIEEKQKELSILEARKEKALVPVKLLEKKAQETLLEAQNKLKEHEEALSDTEDLREHLETALDNVGAREQDVEQRENSILIHEQNLAIMQQQADERAIYIGTAMNDLRSAQLAFNKDIEVRRNELTLTERSLDARKERLDNTEKELTEWAVRLKDERGILDRTIIRTKAEQKKK